MGKHEAGTILTISILILSFAVLNWAACYHVNRITRERCDRMSASILEMRQELEAQNAQVRQVKTDGEIILRLVAGGDFCEIEQ